MRKFLLSISMLSLFSLQSFCVTITYDTQADWDTLTRTGINTIAKPGSVMILNTVSDNFDMPTLPSSWIFDDGGNSTNTFGSGYLDGAGNFLLEAFSGSLWWCTTRDFPRLYQVVDEAENFQIETNFSCIGMPLVDKKYFGIFLSNQDMSYNYALGIERGNSGGQILATDTCGSDVRVTPTDQEIFLKMSIAGDSLSTYYKYSEGDSWIFINNIGGISAPGWAKKYAGLFIYDTSQQNHIRFNYFKYTGETRNTGTMRSGAIDLGSVPKSKGMLYWSQDLKSTGLIKVRTSTSNDAMNWTGWSSWSTDNTGSEIESPNSRYIRFEVELSTVDTVYGPEMHSLTIVYEDINRDKKVMEDLKVYPTIATDTVRIDFRLNDSVKNVSYELKDSSGRTIISSADKDIRAGKHSYMQSINGYSNGVYFVSVRVIAENGNEQKEVKKIVIKK